MSTESWEQPDVSPCSSISKAEPHSLRGIANVLEVGPDAGQEHFVRAQLQILLFVDLFSLERLQLETDAEKVPKVTQESHRVVREGSNDELGHVVLWQAEVQQHEALVRGVDAATSAGDDKGIDQSQKTFAW